MTKVHDNIVTTASYCGTIVFTDVDLERAPTKRLTTMAPLPREGATLWYDTATDEQKVILQQAVSKLSAQLGQRRLLARPYLQDFDRL